MKRFLIKLLLSVFAFTTVLPMIPGIDFHGSFIASVLLSIVFGFILWGVEVVTVLLAGIWTVSTFGLALLWLIPLWITGFWVMPAIALMLTANLLPQYLTINGFIPAAVAGLVMLVIGLVTGKQKKKDEE